jgi:hypothetical protein
MDEIKKFRKVSGKQYSLITAIIYNESQEEVIKYINKRLELVQNVKDSYKRKLANDLVYNFKCHVENEQNRQINKIYLVSCDEINEFELTKKQISILKEYNKPKFFYKTSDKFIIDYIVDLFTDFNFFKVLELNKKNVVEYDINPTKRKLVKKQNVNNQSELLEIINSNIKLVHGTSTFLKNITTDILLFNRRLCDDDVLEEITKLIIIRDHNKLKDLLNNIINPEYENKIIFGGNETKQFTELSMISTLYIHESIYRRFINKYKDYINFPVIEIKKLQSGDISDSLKNDYNCCVGELYYKKNF